MTFFQILDPILYAEMVGGLESNMRRSKKGILLQTVDNVINSRQ